MITPCPLCASELDTSEAMCRTCGWSAPYLVRRRVPTGPAISFAERYRGTPFQAPETHAVATDRTIARGRILVAVAMVATLSLVGIMVLSQLTA